MFNKAFIAATLLCVASPATAQVTGGSLGIEYNAPTDGGDFGGTTYSGAVEYAITRDFAISLDLSGYRLDNISTDAASATLHGVYHFNEQTSLGAFYGADKIDGADALALYGIEAGSEFNGADIEAYIGQVEGASDDALIMGADINYDLANGFALTASAGLTDVDDLSLSRVAFGGAYEIMGGPEFYAEIGNVEVELDGESADQTFVGLGARINFGAARGTTFDQRSLFEILPGF